MSCDNEFDQWYSMQRHQLENEELCRLIFRRGWDAASKAKLKMPTRDEIIKLWELAMRETADGLDAMEYFARAILRPNAGDHAPRSGVGLNELLDLGSENK